MRYRTGRRERRIPASGQEKLMFFTEPPVYAAPAQQSLTFEHAINVLSARLDRIRSGQLTLCAQIKDLREPPRAAPAAFPLGTADPR